MFTFISNIPISRRLRAAFLLAALVPILVILALGGILLALQNAHAQIIQTNLQSLQVAGELEKNLNTISSSLDTAYRIQYNSSTNSTLASLNGLLADINKNSEQFDTGSKQYSDKYKVLDGTMTRDTLNLLRSNAPSTQLPNKQQDAVSDVLVKWWPEYKTAQAAVVEAFKKPATEKEIAPLMTDARTKLYNLEQGWDQVLDIQRDINGLVALPGPSQTTPLWLTVGLAAVLTLAATFAIGTATFRSIIKPLQDLSSLTERISNGETNARVNLVGRDEIYRIATSMNTMLDNIVRLIQETQSQRDALQAQVEKLVSEVSGVGEGDLRVQAEVTADALGVLADSFNYMVEELGSLVVRVKMVANEVDSTTGAVLDRTTQLVETNDAQLKQIAGAVVEVEHLSSTSRQVAERAQSLYEVARNARQNANQGREAVSLVIEGMNRINDNVHATANKVQSLGERSREINDIVEAISGIAHQTNRLALDAAIQAAMAGENGKGFGAVAADIRRLAERSKEQASQITRIVHSVREEIGTVAVSMQDTEREASIGARLTEDAGVALSAIFSAVEHQAREVENINQMATQQLQSSSAIVKIMHGISATTQQSSLSTREASQQMERLARLVEQLRASTEAFKLRNNQDYALNGGSASGTLLENNEAESLLSPTGTFRTVSSTIQSLPGINSQFTPPPSTPRGPAENWPPSQPLPWMPALPAALGAQNSPSSPNWNNGNNVAWASPGQNSNLPPLETSWSGIPQQPQQQQWNGQQQQQQQWNGQQWATPNENPSQPSPWNRPPQAPDPQRNNQR
jgi:methyl-accepting chemotaxis protein